MNEQRGPARKPDVRVVAKMKDGSLAKQYVDLGAWWRQEDGKLRGGWDRRVVAVKLDDGTVIKVADAFLNLQETMQAARPAPARAPATSAPPPDDGFGDAGGGDFGDDLPFDRPFTTAI
jgi:hypothetical protein